MLPCLDRATTIGRGAVGRLVLVTGLVLVAGMAVDAGLASGAGAGTSTVDLLNTAVPVEATPPAGSGITLEVVPLSSAGSRTPGPTSPIPTPPEDQLPVTGKAPVPGWLLTLGSLLIIGGGLIAVVTRKRTRRSSR
jgi:hypothetical protein